MKKLFTLFAVAAMAFAANAATLTVADGTEYNGHFPFYGLYYDTQGTTSQMIYPADELTDMVGKEIAKLEFYVNGAIGVSGGDLEYALDIVDVTEFATTTPFELSENAVVGHSIPVNGSEMYVIELAEPFVYEGGNLLLQTVVTVPGDYRSVYFYGVSTDIVCSLYQYEGWYGMNTYTEAFLPKTTFTYEGSDVPPTPTEKTGAPLFNGYTTDGIHAYFIELIPSEPSTIYYRVQYNDGEFTEWAVYEDILNFTEDGKYRVEAYAIADGKLQSDPVAYEFYVSPFTGLSELVNGKAVAGVRYFNMAGQEMQEANGMTIVVTTYTDGTTSAVKVIK
ncbi:MAG: hypothetical protein II905_10270 [Muribaculaceae bacterium]|nr:hypothetical protein [Muribaculaceae bacterium]